jgi:2-polyprenyl-3-methyl-5-hydroxy-6-metoxy-1,4-benzoquinol methylase
MAVNVCRVCGNEFFKEPLLQYSNMPKAAQNFPDAATLSSEQGADLDVYQCAGCGLVQLSNEPVPYYREVIRAASVSDVIKNLKTRQFTDLIDKYSLHGKRILEIGCGRGEFLALLSTLNVEASGIEYSESAVQECQKSGLNVFRGYPDRESERLANGPFDGFFLLMFLEHMPEPNVALRVIYENLADEAVGLVEVPNFDMMLRNKLFSEFISDHLLYFTKETLQTVLQLNGFELLEQQEIRDEYVISVVVKKRSRLDISHFYDYQAKITADLVDYLEQFDTKTVAIWGAGHQALAVIALSGISGKVRYVVDSAPFKQGKYTPATHLPILAPETLESAPVQAVIVIAGSYSDEVAKIIRGRFDKIQNVAILREYGLEMV